MGEPYYADDQITLWHGDALATLREMPAESVHCVVTSPPYYGLRDYGEPGQYGLEPTPTAYVETMRAVFAEVRRVLTADGTLWLNLGDSYARGNTGQGNAGPSSKLQGGTRPSFRQDGATCVPTKRSGSLPDKNLLGIPWRVAFALQDDGWILRSEVIWAKTNCMPESVVDRPSKTHEHVFMFTRESRYHFDLDAIRIPRSQSTVDWPATGPVGVRRITPGEARAARDVSALPAGRNPGDVWSLPTQPFTEAHFAVMPSALAERCILASCRPGGTVLDPFTGSGTTGMVAQQHGRRFVGIDLSAKYLKLALRTRLAQTALVDDLDGVA